MSPRTIDVNERPPLLQAIPLSLQHLFAMFGATVLVPYLVGLDTSVTLRRVIEEGRAAVG